MKTAIVTGSNGFIGSHLVRQLERRGVTVYCIDNLEYSVTDEELGADGFHEDINEVLYEDLKKWGWLDHRPTVYHMAAISSLPECELNTSKAYQYNVSATAHLLNLVKDDCSHFVFASSNVVEDAMPCLTYPITKILSEQVIQNYAALYGVKASIARFSNVYGLVGKGKNRKLPSYVGHLLDCALNGKDPVIYNNNQDIRRNYIYIKDIVDSLTYLAPRRGCPILRFNGPSNVSTCDILSSINTVFEVDMRPTCELAEDIWNKYEKLESFPRWRLIREVFKDTSTGYSDALNQWSFCDGLEDIKANL